jgi:hypothetical protein
MHWWLVNWTTATSVPSRLFPFQAVKHQAEHEASIFFDCDSEALKGFGRSREVLLVAPRTADASSRPAEDAASNLNSYAVTHQMSMRDVWGPSAKSLVSDAKAHCSGLYYCVCLLPYCFSSFVVDALCSFV